MSLVNTSPSPFLIRILQHAPLDRLQKGVECLTSYTITLTGQDETEIAGFVTNGDGLRYGVVLTADRAFCSCPDAMFRHLLCKHAAVLAMHVIRTPQTEATPEERPINLKLGKVKPTWQACT
jgi:hypothetical protein